MAEEPKTGLSDAVNHEQEASAIDGDLSSTLATAEIPPDLSATGSGHNDVPTSGGQDLVYSSSASSSPRHSTTDNILNDILDDDRLDQVHSTASSRSSLSSIPDSIVIHPMDKSKTLVPANLQTHETGWDFSEKGGPTKMAGSLKRIPKIREHTSPFRHPSSVRAMQMHTEDEDDDFMTPSRLRDDPYRSSPSSVRSFNSSPTKRSGWHSANGTPKKQPVKKEYPLVLLHCNLLSPTLSLPPRVSFPSRQTLEEVLPAKYWKRWKLLEEKVIGSGLIRDRGVLISHPQEMYDVLEERLLESLDLQRPRLQGGHFIGHEEADSGREDDGDRSVDLDEDGDECPDCGSRVIAHNHTSRKWEIKIYAANGLMKSSAWTAAWREMEKVDVEIGLWLPSVVRNELERKVVEQGFQVCVAEEDLNLRAGKDTVSEGQPQTSQAQIDGLDVMNQLDHRDLATPKMKTPRPEPDPAVSVPYERKTASDVDLQTLLINYIRLLASDRRNVAIVFLSVLILFFAIGRGQQRSSLQNMPEIMEFIEIPTVTTIRHCTPSLSPVVQVFAESPVVQDQVRDIEQVPHDQIPAEAAVVQDVRIEQPLGHKIPTEVAESPSVRADVEEVHIEEDISIESTVFATELEKVPIEHGITAIESPVDDVAEETIHEAQEEPSTESPIVQTNMKDIPIASAKAVVEHEAATTTPATVEVIAIESE